MNRVLRPLCLAVLLLMLAPAAAFASGDAADAHGDAAHGETAHADEPTEPASPARVGLTMVVVLLGAANVVIGYRIIGRLRG